MNKILNLHQSNKPENMNDLSLIHLCLYIADEHKYMIGTDMDADS